jgi:hypothetical protein
VQQLAYNYELFCKRNSIPTDKPIPQKYREEKIFVFKDMQYKEYHISL